MLKKAWRWVLYGDSQVWLKGCAGMAILLCFGSYQWIAPLWESYTMLRAQKAALSHTWNSQQALLSTEILTLPGEVPRIPMNKLGEAFGVISNPSEHQVYFAGSTDRIMVLLDFVLMNAYDVKEFHIERSHYKTLLAISQ